jgi:hypothetical protein
MKWQILVLLVGLGAAWACDSDSDDGEQDSWDAEKQLDALTESESVAFCQWAVFELGGEGTADTCGEGDSATGLVVSSETACRNSIFPTCTGDSIKNCISVIKENMCKIHDSEACTDFLTNAAKDGIVENLDFVIKSTNYPPGNGINF